MPKRRASDCEHSGKAPTRIFTGEWIPSARRKERETSDQRQRSSVQGAEETSIITARRAAVTAAAATAPSPPGVSDALRDATCVSALLRPAPVLEAELAPLTSPLVDATFAPPVTPPPALILTEPAAETFAESEPPALMLTEPLD